MAAGPIRVCNAHGRGRRINSGGNALVPVVSPPPYHAFDTSSTSTTTGANESRLGPAEASASRLAPDRAIIVEMALARRRDDARQEAAAASTASGA